MEWGHMGQSTGDHPNHQTTRTARSVYLNGNVQYDIWWLHNVFKVAKVSVRYVLLRPEGWDFFLLFF